MRTIKKNTLKSFLFICLGLAITTMAFGNLKAILDKPTPPWLLCIAKIDSDGCTLTFNAPVDDGGSRIIRYIVESKYEDLPDWAIADRTDFLTSRITNIRKGVKVKFRVKAVNAVGISDPSESTNPIILF